MRQRQEVQEVLRCEREVVKELLGKGGLSEKGPSFPRIADEGHSPEKLFAYRVPMRGVPAA